MSPSSPGVTNQLYQGSGASGVGLAVRSTTIQVSTIVTTHAAPARPIAESKKPFFIRQLPRRSPLVRRRRRGFLLQPIREPLPDPAQAIHQQPRLARARQIVV